MLIIEQGWRIQRGPPYLLRIRREGAPHKKQQTKCCEVLFVSLHPYIVLNAVFNEVI